MPCALRHVGRCGDDVTYVYDDVTHVACAMLGVAVKACRFGEWGLGTGFRV